MQAIINNDFLKHLDDDQVNEMIDYMQRCHFSDNVFIKEGTNGDRLYILETGVLDVSQVKIRALCAKTDSNYN